MDGYHTRYTTGWWIFSRTNYKDGHAWVCDGWRETIYKTIHNPDTRYEYTTSRSTGKFLHMNWGWNEGGMRSNDNNGWFRYNNFSISNGYNFQYKKKMIIRLQP